MIRVVISRRIVCSAFPDNAFKRARTLPGKRRRKIIAKIKIS
jgi:hypothetical protein